MTTGYLARRTRFKLIPLVLLALAASANSAEPRQYTPLTPAAKPAIVDSSIAYPGGNYEVEHIIDGNPTTEYFSRGDGTKTHIDFDFGKPIPLAAIKHVDRADPATVAASELTFSNRADFGDAGEAFETVEIKHANVRSGVTMAAFDAPVTARYVRWRVKRLGPAGHGTVGGAEIAFFTAGKPESNPSKIAVELLPSCALLRGTERTVQPLQVAVDYPYAESNAATLRVADATPVPLRLRPGRRTVQVLVPAVDAQKTVEVSLLIDGQPVVQRQTRLRPVRRWEIYILPHSHVDIGYTHVQTEVEQAHWRYFEEAIDFARRTADYPEGSRFRWNTETMWAVDSYLRQATPQKRQEFIEAVRRGWIHLDALYGNELTGLCRPEELFRLVDCARRVSRQYDLPIDAAMISDVPGYTWGTVPALAHQGVKYLSIGPNHVHRIGHTLEAWGDKAWYWVSPSGEEKLLCWMAGQAYSWFHGGRQGKLTADSPPGPFFEYLGQLEADDYPYDMVQVRYSIGGDNGPPDVELCEFVKRWNKKYAYPKMVIATTREMFREFERRYAAQVPEVRGDFTPYWEDGAGSSARETALARNAAERLVQAEALWAIAGRDGFPDAEFYDAWRDVILYNEHTWGAHCSISQPTSKFTLDQWAIKQAFALAAERRSRELLGKATAGQRERGKTIRAVDVYNTSSWPRTDVVTLPPDTDTASRAGDVVEDAEGNVVSSQTGQAGQLIFLAADVPPMGAKRFCLTPGKAQPAGKAKADDHLLYNETLGLSIDITTGAIERFAAPGIAHNVVDWQSRAGCNGYHYVSGRDPAKSHAGVGPVQITVGEHGPLTASLIVRCRAVKGCRQLTRVYRVFDGLNRVDVHNVVDKRPVFVKEGVHFGFGLNVPGGVMRVDTPWAVVRPEKDQLEGACKNYFSVGRWVDVSAGDYGVTWATVDAPLVEVGAITVDVASPYDPGAWITRLEPTTTFYSYVMNNYWETNYKASQEGPTVFRYSLRPHGKFDAAAATRFGIERSQPLVVVPVDPQAPQVASRVRVESESVIISSLRPTPDGKALIVRLFNAAEAPASVTLTWSEPRPVRVVRSSPREENGQEVRGPIELPAMGIVTLHAALAD